LRRLLAHLHYTGKFQISGQALTGAEGVLRSNGITIHRRAMKMRQVDRRPKIVRQDARARLYRSNLLLAHRRDAKQNLQCLLRR